MIEPQLEPKFSPDLNKIVFVSARSGASGIWLCDCDDLNPMELTPPDGTIVGSPPWSPLARGLHSIAKTGTSDIHEISADGGQCIAERRVSGRKCVRAGPETAGEFISVPIGADTGKFWKTPFTAGQRRQ